MSRKEYIQSLLNGASLLGNLTGVSKREIPEIESIKKYNTVERAWQNTGQYLFNAIDDFSEVVCEEIESYGE